MAERTVSPRILESRWGRVEVDGFGTFKDVRLWPGGAAEWNWKTTGTAHKPGIQIADVADLPATGAEVVLLTRGRAGALGVKQETVDWLENQGLEVRVLDTTAAIEEYNRLRESRRVAAVIHSTC
ncbi:MAG: MTH938/NDUFAF3 family protein [Spirochaetaceae bacterium]